MPDRLPPLSALRAFEVAGRRLSFTKAAEELFVTQAAVSHQIKALEEFLELKLFKRYNRRLELTEAGRAYLPSVQEAFETVRIATRQLRPGRESGHLKISTLSSFATRWLIPRLGRFQEIHPEIDPMISTSQRLAEIGPDAFDVAIRCGLGIYPDLHVVPLMQDAAFPVCSPRLAAALPMDEPEDLRQHTLIHDFSVTRDEDGPDWRQWLKHAGVRGAETSKGPAYNDTGMTIQAAIAGQGVALGRRSLVNDEIKAGHLICPFGPEIATRYSYYFVSTPAAAERPVVQAFLAWLQAELDRDFGRDARSFSG